MDFNEVKGQEHVKRALEVAAAGGHSVLLVGPTGQGKTMLAERVSTICDRQLCRKGEFNEDAKAAVAVRNLVNSDSWIYEYQISALNDSRADNVLYVFESLACPCGWYGDMLQECTCEPVAIKTFWRKIGVSLLDRIDIHIEVPRIKSDEMVKRTGGYGAPERSERIKERVDAAIAFGESHNSIELSTDTHDLLRAAITQLCLSARAYDTIVSLARTIANLEQKDRINLTHIAEALQYRALGRKLWGG